jgi:hypothetical protein
VERNPSPKELEEARQRARADAGRAFREEGSKSVADTPAGHAGPYAFAPEALQAEYDRAFDERLAALRAGA